MKTRGSLPDGFTLIELLTVIAIIAILAALVLSTAGFAQDKAARSRAEGEVSAISSALESYKADNGDYPPGTNTTTTVSGVNTFLVTALMPTTGKVYMEFKKSQTNSTGSFVDPWGNTYGYRYPGTNNGAQFFDLWSSANKTNVTNAWIKNW